MLNGAATVKGVGSIRTLGGRAYEYEPLVSRDPKPRTTPRFATMIDRLFCGRDSVEGPCWMSPGQQQAAANPKEA